MMRFGMIIAATALALIQITQQILFATLTDTNTVLYVTPFFNLVTVWNPGISFGMLQDIPHGQWILSATAMLIIAWLTFWLRKAHHRATALAPCLIIWTFTPSALTGLPLTCPTALSSLGLHCCCAAHSVKLKCHLFNPQRNNLKEKTMKPLLSFLALALLAIPVAVYAQSNNSQSDVPASAQVQQNGNAPMMMCGCPMCMQAMNYGKDENFSMQNYMKEMRQTHQNMGKMMDEMHKNCNGNYDDCPAMHEHMKEMQKMHKDMGMGSMQNNKWHNKWMGNQGQQ